MLEFNEETILWAKGKMVCLKYLKGFPNDPAGIDGFASALLRIAHPVLVQERMKWNPKWDPQDFPYPAAELLNPGPEVLDSVKIHHVKITPVPVNPVDWILSWAADTQDWFPAPVELRREFARKFPTADGVEPQEVDN